MFNFTKKAIFIGKDRSMGLKNGAKYSLTIKNGEYLGKPHLWATIRDGFNLIYCPYASEELLLKNWIIKGWNNGKN